MIDDDVQNVQSEMMEALSEQVDAALVEEAASNAIKERRRSSLVRMNGVELPERTRVWDKFGNPSMVPTAQLMHHLTKPRADSPGERAFFQKRPNIPEKVPTGIVCEFCEETRDSSKPPREFSTRFRKDAHQRAYHEQEWEGARHEEELNSRRLRPEDVRAAFMGLTAAEKKALLGSA